MKDKIEKYLQGALPPDEAAALETQLQTEPSLRAEVELQRLLLENYADPRRLELHQILQAIAGKTPPAPPPARSFLSGYKILLLLAAALLLAVFVFFKMKNRQTPPAAESPTLENPRQNQNPASPQPPAETPQSETLPPAKKQSQKQPAAAPIAAAEPQKFEENPSFEPLLRSAVRAAENAPLQLTASPGGKDFRSQNLEIRWSGKVKTQILKTGQPLQISIFDNQKIDAPLHVFEPTLQNLDAATADFDFSKKLQLPRGLYYFSVQNGADGDILAAGKFTVGKNLE